MPVTIKASWDYIGLRKRRRIDQKNKQENALRRAHIYLENDQVMILDQPNRKFGDDIAKTRLENGKQWMF